MSAKRVRSELELPVWLFLVHVLHVHGLQPKLPAEVNPASNLVCNASVRRLPSSDPEHFWAKQAQRIRDP